MAHARALGYYFTTDEISQLIGEMTDSELDDVAGGRNICGWYYAYY